MVFCFVFSESFVRQDLSQLNEMSTPPLPRSTPMLHGAGDGLPMLTPQTGSSDVTMMKQHMHRMNQRLLRLEHAQVNSLRRERILYPVFAAYLLLQLVKWLSRS